MRSVTALFLTLLFSGLVAAELSLSITVRSQSLTAVEGANKKLELPAIEYGDQIVFSLDAAGEKPVPDYVMLIVGPGSGSFMMKRGSNGNFQLTLDSSLLNAGNKQKLSVYLPPKHMWDFGTVNVPRAPNQEPGELDGPFPLLEHTFRPDTVMPAWWISVGFSGLVLLPWLPLLFSWYKIGVFSGLTGVSQLTSTAHLISTVLFVGSLSLACYSLWLYWVALNIFQAIGAILACGLLLTISGRQMLHYFYLTNALSVE